VAKARRSISVDESDL